MIKTLIALITGMVLTNVLFAGPVLVIGIGGPTGAGKTHFARTIKALTDSPDVIVVSQDDYFIPPPELPVEHYINGEPNGDHPTAMDFSEMVANVVALKKGEATDMPQYDFISDTRAAKKTVGPAKVIIVEGIHAFWNPQLRQLFDYRIYVDAPGDERLSRRLIRDTQERGKEMRQVLAYYNSIVRPMQREYVEPTQVFADQVVNGEDPRAEAFEVSAEILRYLKRLKDNSAPFFFTRKVNDLRSFSAVHRGETIQQLMLQQGRDAVLVLGGSLRPPTLDHLTLLVQNMYRFGFTKGKLVPSNSYKPGAINNSAALFLSRTAIEHFDQALEANHIGYRDFVATSIDGSMWKSANGVDYHVEVDSSEIDILDPIVEGEDRRTLLAFKSLKDKAGGDPRSLFWLAGGDSFTSLPKWNSKWEEHLELANWIIVSRREFQGRANDVSFQANDPLHLFLPENIRKNYNYYFDHTMATHVYENKDPKRPNLYVIELVGSGAISSTSVRNSIQGENHTVARAGTIPAVYEASIAYGFFERQVEDSSATASCSQPFQGPRVEGPNATGQL